MYNLVFLNIYTPIFSKTLCQGSSISFFVINQKYTCKIRQTSKETYSLEETTWNANHWEHFPVVCIPQKFVGSPVTQYYTALSNIYKLLCFVSDRSVPFFREEDNPRYGFSAGKVKEDMLADGLTWIFRHILRTFKIYILSFILIELFMNSSLI